MPTPSLTALLLGAIQVHSGGDVSVNISADTEHLMQSDIAARVEGERTQRCGTPECVNWRDGKRTEKSE